MRRLSCGGGSWHRLLAGGAVVASVFAQAGGAGGATSFVNWPAYLFKPAHSSYGAQATAITRANAGSLVHAWTWTPPAPTMTGQPAGNLNATPVVYRGVVYVGTNSGIFFALSESTGKVRWQRFVGFTPALTCAARGFTSTATVARDPTSSRLTVYVGAADGYLYALDATTGSLVWRAPVVLPSASVNDYYLWGSPTVSGGHVYIGIASQCDTPLVRGGLEELSQTDGSLLATYSTVPSGSVGGSIWSSAAVTSTGDVVVTTGNPDPSSPSAGDSISIVRLSSSLTRKSSWTAPATELADDDDFGASPVLFKASLAGSTVQLVGACNKNGRFYALRLGRLSAGPLWTAQVAGSSPPTSGPHCLASAAWDGSRLFVAGKDTTIGGTSYNGSVRRLDPATGATIWATGLAGGVIGTPTLDGADVLAVATYDTATGAANAAYLLDADTGAILATLDTGGAREFAQPVFADDYLLLATVNAGLRAYRAP